MAALRSMLLICLCLLALHAHAVWPCPNGTRCAIAPRLIRGLIADMRQQLDQLGGNAPPAKACDLLWLMGTAAVNVNDDTALTEAVLRLDSLAAARHFVLAAASAGFLRGGTAVEQGVRPRQAM